MTSEGVQSLKKSLGQLDVQRKSLEMEAEAITSELTAKPENGGEPIGIDTPLVDREGFPRADIDIYRARELRHRLSRIRTDHKELMKKVDTILSQIAVVQNPSKLEQEKKEQDARFAPKPKPKFDPVSGKWVVKNWDNTVSGVVGGNRRSFDNLGESPEGSRIDHGLQAMEINNNNNVPTSSAQRQAPPLPTTSGPPFAKIDGVSPLSPASEAGLEEGDVIVTFGSINHTNHNNLHALMGVVTSAADEQREIPIGLLRNGAGVHLGLMPKPWSGRGLIGCHIVPYAAGG